MQPHDVMTNDDISNYPSGEDAPLRATANALAQVEGAETLILVEGVSDQIALETLAERQSRDLAGQGIVIVPVGGASAIAKYVDELGTGGVRLGGLCDVAERSFYERALLPSGHAVFVCEADLEDELLRAVGQDRVEAVVSEVGELGALRTLQKQAPWVGRSFDEQIRRFLGSKSRRKSRYAKLFTLACPEDQIPAPLVGILDWAEGRVTPHL